MLFIRTAYVTFIFAGRKGGIFVNEPFLTYSKYICI